VRERSPARETDARALPVASLARAVPAPDPSFADLYRDTYADMVRLAVLLTGSVDIAQDVVQDAFVSVHRAWARVREPRAYLRRAVVNACTSHHRRVFRERRAKAGTGATTVELGADELFDVLASLPARQRAAIVLRYWHGLDDQGIASALGCRPGTVGSLLHRATARLREVIEK
jgi:RNA polymerase sigma-70 factor (sigma-E family)